MNKYIFGEAMRKSTQKRHDKVKELVEFYNKEKGYTVKMSIRIVADQVGYTERTIKDIIYPWK